MMNADLDHSLWKITWALLQIAYNILLHSWIVNFSNFTHAIKTGHLNTLKGISLKIILEVDWQNKSRSARTGESGPTGHLRGVKFFRGRPPSPTVSLFFWVAAEENLKFCGWEQNLEPISTSKLYLPNPPPVPFHPQPVTTWRKYSRKKGLKGQRKI